MGLNAYAINCFNLYMYFTIYSSVGAIQFVFEYIWLQHVN